ncbi:MAG: ATP-dependent sacrificial sulfur transferase LarE [Armatimonadetes bacterium]|nr:ATP-dependent sacrificial sulfur transferase LarE [Armatimonadota bacterium]
MNQKLDDLRANLGGMGRVIIAFSGGVDSAFLLQVARQELGDRAVAIIGISPSLLPEELDEARQVAAQIGAPLREVETHEIENQNYASNPTNRCYFCKSELFDVLQKVAQDEGFDAVCDGTNLDDLKEWRPGAQAGSERAVRSPLREANLSKAEIRELSRELGLPTWDKPAMPCLSSRIPYGQSVTREALHRIGRAEVWLREKGLREVRVRHYLENDAPQARIEVAPDEMATLFEFWNQIGPKLREWGFESILLDVEGYKRGKMNVAAKVGPQPIQLLLK